MKEKIQIKNISGLFVINDLSNDMRKKVTCLTMNYKDIARHFSSAVYLDGTAIVLVLSGTGCVTVNYRSYTFCENSLLLFSFSHLFHFEKYTADISCLCLFVSKEFMAEMDSTAMIFQRIKYGVRLYSQPLIQLEPSHRDILSQRILMVDHSIDNKDHYYYRDVIQTSLFSFFLDLSDMIERHGGRSSGDATTRKESLVQSFIELLVTHYRQEHKVEFYASRLHISTHYLTLIVKSVTGQSVSDFIFEMLYSESRTLLIHSKLSIQEITTALNFSDQSAFGKFFKRRSGLSPLEFRRVYEYAGDIKIMERS